MESIGSPEQDFLRREQMVKDFDCDELFFLLANCGKEEIRALLEIEVEFKDCGCR